MATDSIARRPVGLTLAAGLLLAAPAAAHDAATTPAPPQEVATRAASTRASAVDLVITDTALFDARTGRVLPGRTVVVDDGEIVAVDDARKPVPSAARTIDAAGRMLAPGLIDAHSHLAYLLGDSVSTGGGMITNLSTDPDSVARYRRAYADAYIPHGVTTVRDAGSAESDVAMLADWMADPVPWAPDVFPVGGALASHEEGRTPFPGHTIVASPAEARAKVRAYHAMGLRQIKLYWRLREPEFRAALDEARRLGMTPTGHVDFKVLGFDRALDLGLRSFEHAYTVGVGAMTREEYLTAWREGLPEWIGDRSRGRFYLGVMQYFADLGPDDPEMLALIDRLAGTGSTVVPTLHLFAQRLGLAYYDAPPTGEFDDMSALTPEQLAHFREGYEILAGYVRRMHEAGVRLAVGTDWVEPGRAALSELLLLHEAGIPMADVLRMATLDGARALDIADEVGTVEPGMKANLVLVDGDPLARPEALTGAKTVIKDGVVAADGIGLLEDRTPDRTGSAPARTDGQAGAARAARSPESPVRLAVLLAVDQLGQNLLERYEYLFTGGLRRLLDGGRWYANARVDHAVTVSHPGHVTLSTGLDPARHGIVDAAFYETTATGERRFVDAVRDSTQQILGVESSPGASPRQILAPGLWDWVREADPDARRVAVGTGRYASLLYARSPGDVYWFSPFAPGYVTSSYYRDEYPDWVERFNREVFPRFMADTVWTSRVSDAARGLARRDDAPYESGGRHPTFPHRFHDEVRAEYHDAPAAQANWIGSTPALDEATLALAEHAVRERELGGRDATDLLVVVLSQVDDIGHWYGPRSLEQLDNLLRLDAALGRFFDALDTRVGRGRWAVALSADHAAPPAPEHRRAMGEPATRVTGEDLERALDAAERAASAAETDAERARRMAAAVESLDWVADAMTPDELLKGEPTDSFIALYRNSYSAERVPRYPLFSFEDGMSSVAEAGVAVRLAEHAMLDLDTSVHGSPYAYDRHVPVVFYGPGVPRGHVDERVTTKDVAPTLARLVGLPVPARLDGRVLIDAVATTDRR